MNYIRNLYCIGCNACTKACTQDLNVMQYIAYAQRGELREMCRGIFDCVAADARLVRCPAGISHPMVGLWQDVSPVNILH